MVFGKLKAPDILTLSGALHDPGRKSYLLESANDQVQWR